MATSASTSLFVSFAGALPFLNSLNGGFVFDDTEAIVNNADVLPDSPWASVFVHDFWGHRLTSNISHKSYRPLTTLTFRWNYWWAGGLHPFGFHLVNLVLHAVVCFLVHRVNVHLFAPRRHSRLLRSSTSSSSSSTTTGNDGHLWALFSSLLFAVHPVHTEVVSGLVGRADLLCSVFLLLCVLKYRSWSWSGGRRARISVLGDHRKWMDPFGILFMSAVAMLCKEYGITALLLCFAYDVVDAAAGGVAELPRRESNGLTKPKLAKIEGQTQGQSQSQPQGQPSLISRMTLLFASAVFLLYLRWTVMGSSPPRFHPEDNPPAFADSWVARVLTRHYLYALNAWLMVLPRWLCFDWSMSCVPLVENPQDPRVLAAGLFWAVVFGLVCRAFVSWTSARESCDWRNIVIGLAWMAIPFLPATNVLFTVGFVIAERLLYLPSIGYCILVTVGFQRLLHFFSPSDPKKGAATRAVFHALAVTMLALFAFRSAQRSKDWLSERSLFRSGLSVCPNNAKVHYNIAKEAADSGDEDTAILHYQMALRLNPVYDQAMNNLANILKARGHLETAAELLENATEIRPDFAAAWMNLGIVYAELKRQDLAETSYKNALVHRPRYPDCYYNLGNLYVDQGRSEDALEAWSTAIQLKPTHSLAWINLIILLDSRGDLEAARNVAHDALVHLPDDPGIHFNLANTLGKLNDFPESEKHFLRAVELRPGMASYHSNLGVLYHRWRKFGRARRCYESAIRLDPTLKSAKDNLALLKDKS